MVIVVVLRIGSFGVTRRNGQVSLSEFRALGKRPLNHWEYAGERSHCSVEEYKILRRSLGKESRRSGRVTIRSRALRLRGNGRGQDGVCMEI